MILPKRANDGTYIFYIEARVVDLFELRGEIWAQATYFLMHRAAYYADMAIANISFVVNLQGIKISMFPKVTGRDLEITKLFVDASPARFVFLYFINCPL
eukprot:UN28435